MPEELFSLQALSNPKVLITLSLGGFLVGFGARYAGGCTSGHAISGLSHDASMRYNVLYRNKRQKFRVAPRQSRLANDGYDGAILLSLRGSKIRFGNLYFEE